VPQDKLFLVPFAALQNDQGEFLIEKHTVAIAPSIQALELLRSQPTTPSGQALVVGNPTMPKVIVETQQPPEELAPLPGAEIEAKQIAQLLNTQPLIGDAATKSQVVQQMGQASIIHLATHGLMDDFKGLGMPGAIALAPSGKENGLLTSDEIMRLKLKADMVVLSACDTGRGNITGDGVIGLSRSLLSAGAKSVVVSLWAVPDGATVDLMTAFYQQIPQGQDRAIAMRQAMLQSIQKYPNPRDWAAFTVIGN
jgi:CHAT domain-containing protein